MINTLTLKEKKQALSFQKEASRVQSHSSFKREEQRFLNIAKDLKANRDRDSFRRTQDMSKELAKDFCNISREAVSIGGTMPLECLMCVNRIGHLDKCLPCRDFSNYQEKGAQPCTSQPN